VASNFETLECWKSCNDLKTYIRTEILTYLPKEEKYQLYSQLLRATRSATANIAEGWGRYHSKDQIKFLIQARGSVAEILDHSLEAVNWDYISEEKLKEVRVKVDNSLKLINGYIRFLRKNL